MLVSLSNAFDVETIDRLLFLDSFAKDFLVVSGDGVLLFSRLIAAGFATCDLKANNNFQLVTYAVNIHEKGRLLVEAWKSGERTRLTTVLGGSTPSEPEGEDPPVK
jgi:hypothetical protein